MLDLSLEQRREYLRNYSKLVELFGQDLVDAGLMRYTMDQLCEVHQIPLQDAWGRPAANVRNEPWQKPFLCLGNKWTYYRFVKDGWEKLVRTPVTEWQIPSQYQEGHQAEYIVRPALHAKFPWLASFRLDIYAQYFYSNHDDDFYVNLGYGYWINNSFNSLYVPLRAFMEGDVAAIVKRNQEYFKWYTKTDSVWNAMKLDPTVIAFLNIIKK